MATHTQTSLIGFFREDGKTKPITAPSARAHMAKPGKLDVKGFIKEHEHPKFDSSKFTPSPDGSYTCDYCHAKKKKMTQWRHTTGKVLNLCFNCQHFGEPYRDSGVGITGWERVDPWVKKRAQPGLSHQR